MLNNEKESTTISIRIDKTLKSNSEKLFDELGLNISSACTLFLKQALRENGIPFSINLNTPNAATIKAIQEAQAVSRDKNSKSYKSFSEIVGDLDADV